MTPTPEGILQKIQKLQALADRAGTEAEAALAAARVAELCEQHNLDIGVATLFEEEKTATESLHLHDSSRWAAHWSQLSHACGDMFNVGHYRKPAGVPLKDARGFVTGSKEVQALVFYGLKANVLSATVTYEYYLASVEVLLEGYIREGNHINGASEMRSFRIGCASRIAEEVGKVLGAKRNLIQQSIQSTALVRLENQLIQSHRKTLHLHSTGCASGAASRDHYRAGYAAGGRVDIHGARSNRMLR